MSAGFRSRLSDVRRAPRGAGRPRGLKTKAMRALAAPRIIRACLDRRPGGFPAREVFDGVAEFQGVYTDANALGTALGDGVRGSGLGMHRGPDGHFLRCRDNAALAAGDLDEDGFAALAADLGFPGPDELAAAIDELPPAPGA